jgi:hypothetical protein
MAAHAQGTLPKIVTDETIFRLQDLVHSDFIMGISDKDFEVTHE